MSAVAKRSRPAAHLALVEGVRGFRLIVQRGRGETYGVVLEETYGDSGNTISAALTTTTPAQTGRVIDALFVALKQSGYPPSALSYTRKAPIKLGEAEGVRLALILLSTGPIAKHERVRSLVAGINAISTEETYYWYSKCVGINASRSRKALRTLLADD